ncbi:electron transfer flavoprotein subunit beta/FixA family protein [Clostridium sp. P21]|uniref:Electron transfer flavoprotein small subunit n=1 Tax=Clostridium muellerianum TaxID=2716538 RepID=A0A7Y0EJ46_9CLOT|nr:electron transfer flavoprotein subunit beta/FixA family protein [Clostridium muellerianum]NMM64436.1 electron transfer flavoprotein subunit beta/FixA family protein [Clostridium muellerianum]
MNIVVLIKQVPDMERVKFDREKGVVDRKSAGTEINPFDLNALETAVSISEKMDAKVTVISMGLPSADEALKEAIARGAHEGILLSDRSFGGADTKATSKTLAGAISKIGKFDLIIAGEKTVDGDTGQVGPEIAEILDIPHISYVEKIEDINQDNIVAQCELWGGTYLKKAKFPVLITVTKYINEPRLPTFKSKMKARKAKITVWDMEELKEVLTLEEVGFKGSPTKVKKIEVPQSAKREGKLFRENINEGIEEIITVLEDKKVLGV